MPKRKIAENDWLTLQVQVTRVWNGEITVYIKSAGQKVTIRADSEEIVDVTKERRKSLFDEKD